MPSGGGDDCGVHNSVVTVELLLDVDNLLLRLGTFVERLRQL